LSSGGLSPACALLHLEPTLVRREILGELLWRRQLLAGGGAAGWWQDPSLPQAFPPAEFPWKDFRGNSAPLERDRGVLGRTREDVRTVRPDASTAQIW
jgi:hypothetical protein